MFLLAWGIFWDHSQPYRPSLSRVIDKRSYKFCAKLSVRENAKSKILKNLTVQKRPAQFSNEKLFWNPWINTLLLLFHKNLRTLKTRPRMNNASFFKILRLRPNRKIFFHNSNAKRFVWSRHFGKVSWVTSYDLLRMIWFNAKGEEKRCKFSMSYYLWPRRSEKLLSAIFGLSAENLWGSQEGSRA